MAIQKLKVFSAGNRMATRCEAETILRVNKDKRKVEIVSVSLLPKVIYRFSQG